VWGSMRSMLAIQNEAVVVHLYNLILLLLLKMQMITVSLSQTKRCRGTLQCQHVCNRRAEPEYSARNDKRPAEVSHWKRNRKKNVFSSWRNVDSDEAALTEEGKPHSWCSHWESAVAECGTFGATTNVSETEERRRRRPSTSAVRRRLSAR